MRTRDVVLQWAFKVLSLVVAKLVRRPFCLWISSL
jgi:hypothetical protein